MKWITTGLIVILAFVAQTSSAEQRGPWTFNNITVLTFPSSKVKVHRTADHRGVRLALPVWNEEIEREMKDVLDDSPLTYRLHLLPMAAMGVEVYSQAMDIDFAVRQNKGLTQIIIGELRTQRVVLNIIGDNQRIAPLPKEVYNLLKEGKLSSARRKMGKLKTTGTYKRILNRARRGVLSSIIYGPNSMQCPGLPRILKNPAIHEGMVLSAWCLRASGKPHRAIQYLEALDDAPMMPEVASRSHSLRARIVAGLVLSADRADLPIFAAAYSLKHWGTVRVALNSTSFLETVARNLRKVGVGNLFPLIADAEIAKIADNRQAVLAPALVESFLSAGYYVRALDAATFFLTARQPDWYKARLMRVRGYAELQEGNWKEARRDLVEARRHLGDWSLRDELALIEAQLRGEGSVASLEKNLREAVRKERRLNSVSSGVQYWMERLLGEIQVGMGNLPEEDVFDILPAHVLFRSAQKIQKTNRKSYEKLIKRATQSKGGWGDLAEIEIETEQIEDEIKKYRNAIRVMR
ncbi:MAG: hypothetical protein GY854_15645 [Deltaproteobacteria bacterium]|nr:hypothetical protein [Deltaproteobacteria bacterium]